MEIEQLKLILEATKGVGDTALTVTGIYFAKDFIISCIGYGVGFYALKQAGVTLKTLISTIADSGENASTVKTLMSAIGSYGQPTSGERLKLINLLDKGKEAEAAENKTK